MRRVTMIFCTAPLFWALFSASDSFGATTPTDGYTLCAVEGAVCKISAPSTVIYGAGDKWSAPKAFAADTPCTNAVFRDPINGIVKACWVKADAPAPDPVPEPVPDPVPTPEPAASGPAPAVPSASMQSAITIQVSPGNFPPPTAMFRPPMGWSIHTARTLGFAPENPPICTASVPGIAAHTVVFTGTSPDGDWTYTTCATAYGWVGWWRMTRRGSTTAAPTVPLADK